MPKNVLLITGRADIGGGPRHVFDLANYIKKECPKDFQIYIASPDSRPYFTKYSEIANEHFILPHRRFSIFTLFSLISFVIKNKIDIIHSHGFAAGLYSRFFYLLGIRVIHTYHGIHFQRNIFSFLKKNVAIMLQFFTDHFIFVSEDEFLVAKANHLLFKKKFSIIPNGVDFSKTVLPRSHSQEIVLGNLTRPDPQKGNDILVEYFSRLRKVVPNLKLIVAGKKDESLNVASHEGIIFCGEVADPMKFLENIDIYVSCSRGEGLPYAVLEAISCKKPCLLSDVTGHRVILDRRYLFELNNYQDFEGKYFQIVNGHYNQEKSYALCKEKFDINKNIPLVLEIYKKH